ncbi:hypothetical protein PMI42_00138 [Bradyrhizobium sp. YR681]|uniref:hypothetical protein n=1 Tax=Bradyrhizobium sp. YR681 TaxID=1144344 RepID=UPI000270EE2F|nr:hypothetical protein [Bradyrhizobium sp. YR681]EJN16303.1 hypothetical protein PMI42_00138 [Bradyrhizobium sp. YR681]
MQTNDNGEAISLPIASLYKHWITADAVKARMLLETHAAEDMPPQLVAEAQKWSQVQTMAVFYGLFYVVIEGYRELGLKDESIDALLEAHDYESRLRRFRNAVFHYQEDPFDRRLIEFLDAKDSEHWGKALYEAFEKFFAKVLPIRQTVERLRNLEADKA